MANILYDAKLVEAVINRDEEAFTIFYEKYYGFVFGRCLKSIRNRDLVEELTSDIFMKLWNKIHQWNRGRGEFDHWFSILIKNSIIDALRKANRCPEEPVDHQSEIDVYENELTELPDPLKDLIKNDSKKILEMALDSLKNENYKTVIELQTYEQLSVDEISDILKRPSGTIKIWLHRAKKELRKRILINSYNSI